MVSFDGMYPDEQILVSDDFGMLHPGGGFTNGKLILTQLRLVFVIGGGLFSKPRTDHAIDLHLITGVAIEPAQSLGVNLRVDFSTIEGSSTVWYNGRINKANKIADYISQSMNYGLR